MIPLTLAEIARAVGGTAHGPVQAMGGPGLTVTGPVVIDSREVTAGTLFAAIAGARSDGHDFAPAAYSAGAVAVLGSRPVDGPCVVADDVDRADQAGRTRPGPAEPRRYRAHRIGWQDHDQGPARPDPRARGADGRHLAFL